MRWQKPTEQQFRGTPCPSCERLLQKASPYEQSHEHNPHARIVFLLIGRKNSTIAGCQRSPLCKRLPAYPTLMLFSLGEGEVPYGLSAYWPGTVHPSISGRINRFLESDLASLLAPNSGLRSSPIDAVLAFKWRSPPISKRLLSLDGILM